MTAQNCRSESRRPNKTAEREADRTGQSREEAGSQKNTRPEARRIKGRKDAKVAEHMWRRE